MNPPTTDEQLLKQFVKGDQHSLGQLAQRYELPLLGLACGLLAGQRDLAMDAVQETWMRVIRFGHSFNGKSSVKTWLYRIAINQCRNLQSKPRAGSSNIDDAPQSQPEHGGPAEEAQENEQNLVLLNAVRQLGEQKRSIVLLCYHAGMTHEQAAEILNIPLGTLKSRLHAAFEQLRATLSPEAVK